MMELFAYLRNLFGLDGLAIIGAVGCIVIIFVGQWLNIWGFRQKQDFDINEHPGNRSTELGRRNQDKYWEDKNG
jgi:hypothetical protein